MSLPLCQAAAELDVHPQTLRAWVRRDGAPVVQRGSAGRGKAALYDVAAIRAWRNPSVSPAASIRVLAAQIPELVADACFKSFVAIQGPHKRACADPLAGAWYVITATLLDRLRLDDPSIPEITSTPAKVSALREVFAQSGTVQTSTSNMRR